MPITTEYSRYLSDPTLAGASAAIAAAIATAPALRGLTDADVNHRPRGAGAWSRKEILAHLVDSAANNTQRFVRAQIPAHWTSGTLVLPGYQQADWIRVQSWATRSWVDVLELWVALNRHIVHIVEHFDRAMLATPCSVGGDPALPIEHLIVDYAGHLVHHHRQITAR